MFEKKRFDLFLFLPAILILIFSFGMISSVSPENLISHFVYSGIAIFFFFLFYFFDFDILVSLSPFIYIFSLIFLLLPFVFGTVTRGSVRWIPIGSYTVQPSEIIKPFLCVIGAWFWRKKDFSLKNLFYFLLLFMPFFILIFLQPDLGTMLVVLAIFMGLVIFSNIDIKQIGLFLLFSFLILPVSWFALKDYQKVRFLHFLNPSLDPLGQGYNQIQAMISVGSGGFFGLGLGRGTQSHLFFLPEKHTDFIFSSMAEEFGFAGCFVLLILYLFLFLKIIKILSNCREIDSFLITVGIFFTLFFQTIVNIGMNIGLMPITGITLPLFSYGGSSLLATMICLGILENISSRAVNNKIVSIRHF